MIAWAEPLVNYAEQSNAWHGVAVEYLAWVICSEGILHCLHCSVGKAWRGVLGPHILSDMCIAGGVSCWGSVCSADGRACAGGESVAARDGTAELADHGAPRAVFHLQVIPEVLWLRCKPRVEVVLFWQTEGEICNGAEA